MSNSVNNIFRNAMDENWCTKPFCTTCGSQEFKSAINHEISNNHNFLDHLKNCDFSIIEGQENWTGGIYRIFQTPHLIPKSTDVLTYWIERNDITPTQYNYLFFYVVRYSRNTDLKDKWVFKLTDLAKATNNESIVESLLICLKEKVICFPKLINLVEEKFINSSKIKKVYKK